MSFNLSSLALGHAAACIGENLMIVGGRSDVSRFRDLWLLDFSVSRHDDDEDLSYKVDASYFQWTKCVADALPHPRWDFSLIAVPAIPHTYVGIQQCSTLNSTHKSPLV